MSLSEAPLSTYVQYIQSTVILYAVKDQNAGKLSITLSLLEIYDEIV